MNKKPGLTRRQLITTSASAGAGLVLAAGLGTAQAAPTFKRSPHQVPRRVLGKTKQKIPILVFGGAVPLNARFDPKLAEAYRYGVDYIDAADCYSGGRCELSVASFLRKSKLRKDLWITSKSDEHDVAGFERTLATSLRKLDTKFIDMYYLHALRNDKYLTAELAKKVEAMKKAGKIRFFGFSAHHGNAAELLQKASQLPWIDSVMFRYNFRQYGNKELNKAIDAAARAGVGLIAMKTQGSEASFRKAWKKFEKTGKWNKHQAVLKAVWEDKRITAAVSHMDNLDKLRENIGAALDKTKLTALEHDSLQRYATATRGLACDGCDHICGPHVDGPVAIGDTMRFLMYHDTYGERDKARALFGALPGAARQLDRDFRGAAAACPHGVDVVARMQRARKVLT